MPKQPVDKNLAKMLAFQNSKLMNAGTSEGVKKGWDTRKHGAFNPSGDTRELFYHLTARKPVDEKELKSNGSVIRASELHPDQVAAFLAKPKIKIDPDNLLQDVPSIKEANKTTIGGSKNLEFHATDPSGTKHYYVNTEGSDYPRYVAKIEDVQHAASPTVVQSQPDKPQSNKEFGQQIATGSGGTHLLSQETNNGRVIHLVGVPDPSKSAKETETFIKHGAFGADSKSTSVELNPEIGQAITHFTKGDKRHSVIYTLKK